MIAASDPLEFVPRGRQQVARHPGPPEPIFHHKDFNDHLQMRLEKVSLSEDIFNEFWVLRRAPEAECTSHSGEKDKKPQSKYNHLANKSQANITRHSDSKECFKTPDGSQYRSEGKRFSDASVKFPNKRFSCGFNDRQNDTRSGNENCPVSYVNSQIEPGFMEDELYVKGQIAVWSRGLLNNIDQQDNGRKVISCYTVPLPIKQALWSTFYCEKPEFDPNLDDLFYKSDEAAGMPVPAICLVDSHHVRVFVIKGEQFVIPMPFHIDKVWNTKFGILIERLTNGSSFSKEKQLLDNSCSIFSLSYPLDDICPVALSRNLSITKLMSDNLKLVYTSENPSICMVFDTQTKEHSVYKIRKVRPDEKDYGEAQSGCHSATHNSQRLKSRLSSLVAWDNLMTSGHMVTPTPISVSKPPTHEKLFNTHKSRSLSSMAAISRCQSPALTDVESPWLGHSSKKDICRGFMPTADINTTAKSFFDCSRAMSHLTSTPHICLELLWTDTVSAQDPVTGSPATTVFLSEDLVKQWYLCYILPVRFQLSVVKVDFSGPNMVFGLLTSISAKDAINIPHLRMMAILEHNGNVTLYSGLSIVGKLHLNGTLLQHTPSPYVRRYTISPFPRRSSLLPLSKPSEPIFDEHLFSPVLPSPAYSQSKAPQCQNPTPLRYTFETRADKKATLVGLMDSIENRITLKYSDDSFYRITLPNITHSCLIERCLAALRQCLFKDAALILVCRWYSMRNVIGSKEMDTKQEWDMFTNLLLELCGYDDEHLFEKPEIPAVKKPKTTPASSDDDWLYLLNKSAHKPMNNQLCKLLKLSECQAEPQLQTASQKIHINHKAVLFPYLKYVHYILHLLYEDFKLNTLYSECLEPLAKLLSKISRDLGLREFALHYWKDFPGEIVVSGPKIDEELLKTLNVTVGLSDKPVGIFEHIYGLLKGNYLAPYPYFANVNRRSRDIVQLCGVLSESNRPSPSQILLDSFVKDVAGLESHQSVQHKSVQMNCSKFEQIILIMVDMNIDTRFMETLPTGIYYLLYNALWKCRENPPSDWPVEAYHLLWRDDLVAQAQKSDMEKTNICFQLQESMPNTKQEIADLDGMEDIDCSLTKIRFSEDVRVEEARKMLISSKPVLITLIQRPDVSDHDFIEEQEKHLYGVCIRTMSLPVGRGMMTLRTATPIITEPLPAPVLCLTGKALPRGNTVELNHIDTPANMNLWPIFHNGVANGLRITPDAQNIDSTWIIFNKPKAGADAQMEHAGFLMALGLNGHLKNLLVCQMSTFDYLSNSKTHEMISVGILLGLSADFRGTCHHFLTTILAIYIEALLPPTSMELDICHNLQVAGLLGLGLLYQRSAHRHMTEVLLSEIGRPPGPEMENSVDRESHSLAAGLALGLVMLKHGNQPTGMSDLNVPDTLHYYMVGGNKRPLTGSQKDKYKTPSFQIREGSSVNLDVTAPGATLAIGLMYLGSGNKAVADWMAPPETQYLLDFVRPDFLMLRILSRSLILWDNIEPSKEWVIGEVPATIRPYCMVTPTNDADIDYEAMNQAYCNIVAGACFALGLKFAGSADADAFETLLYFCHMFTSLTGKSIAELAGKATIETCLNVLLLSAAMVMAGTGNLELMRLVRHLRRRVGIPNSAIVTYGSHLAIHMALGLLFLGGGRYTLSNSPSNVAALICAFYPKFPTHSNDNRYHLQAFRHLYVLAVEPRLLIPKDVLYEDICYAKLRVVKLGGREMTIKGPGLIPDPNTLNKVMVDDDRYWPVVFERGRNWDLLTKILTTTGYIEVKQRAGCLSYLSDKFGYHSDLARTLTHSKVVPWDPSSNAIVSFTSDESIRKFCETVLHVDKTKSTRFEQRFVQLLTRTVYDAVVKDKLMIIGVMVALLKVVINLQSQSDVIGIWQLKIILQQVLLESVNTSLISKETMLALQQEVVVLLESAEANLKPVLHKYLHGEDFEASVHLAAYVTFYQLAPNCCLDNRKNVLEQAVAMRGAGSSAEVLAQLLRLQQ